ncbi:hypothetical protein A1O7_01687 [Cladophialophora yegresii CBS 114405]|uniref:Major facilitator superfamily (MFS) profile domain-containing protein n=1 Tax=Cladophialophora yegresii CBS 114405 TaxID=1182544 RepID=W9WL89_9EURO|nr:uncharacterized protein A1O7_01687 [Cladophialophora yegresii CBS 114405]EXJ65346.1 hypothetical protein A1O7_01687 [Cladophialophora yegresii CBS 114405]
MAGRHTGGRRRSSTHQRHGDEDGTAPLLLSRTRSLEDISVAESVAVQEIAPEDDDGPEAPAGRWPRSVPYLLLLCAFLTSLSFGVTQVPLLYVFRLMTCDAYYKDHPSRVLEDAQYSESKTITSIFWRALVALSPVSTFEAPGTPDRCSIRPIESSTAMSVSLLGASTTVFGTANLFLTGTLIKRIGVKPTLMTQILFPAVRLVVQNVGVEVWGSTGIIIIQLSQIFTVIGGPSGYLLALNTFITEVVDYEERTAALGRLTGSMFFGSAMGFLLGGIAGESFGIKAPFRLTLVLFLLVCVYVFIFLPHIPPAEKIEDDADSMKAKKGTSAIGKFFGPLTVFAPRKFITRDGVVRREYGAFLLAWGVYLGILATGYLVTLLQLYATNVFEFGTKQNGALIFMYSMLRGVFLTFAFPKLIAIGRRVTSKREKREAPTPPEREPLLSASENSSLSSNNKDEGPPQERTFAFDLTYTKFSLIADGLLTLLCSFVRQGWQMYLVAAVLPFAAGTGSAAKGTVLQMVGSHATSSERTDALAGVSLVENIARLSTTSIFGIIFAAFASIGRTELVFACNAAVALIGFVVLLFARFPPEGSRRLDQKDTSTPAS